MKILPKIREKIQYQILPLVKKKWQAMFELGIKSFSIQSFVSINSNARTSRDNDIVAERQIYRLLDRNIDEQLCSMLLNLKLSVIEVSLVKI